MTDLSMYASKNKRAKEKKVIEHDFWPTPYEVAVKCVKHLPTISSNARVLDAGCGLNGVWGQAFQSWARQSPLEMYIVGLDIQEPDYEEKLDLIYDRRIWGQDFTTYESFGHGNYGLIFGNPPFSLFQEFWFRSMELLEDDGYIAWLLPLNYLQPRKNYDKIWSQRNLKYVYTLTKRIDWTGQKGPSGQHAFYIWQKNFFDEPILRWING